MATVEEKLSALRAERGVVRSGFTKASTKLASLLTDKESSEHDIVLTYKTLCNKYNTLVAKDKDILALLTQEADFQAEYDKIDEYNDKFHAMEMDYGTRFSSSKPSTPTQVVGDKLTHKLPKLEFKKFDGKPLNWLPFWNQFNSKIHANSNIPVEDKFQYLQNNMVPGSPAAECVDVFPLTAANYPLVIQQLKERFAPDELLIEVYIRELLKLVIQQAMNPDEVQLDSLVNKLEAQLKNLDTLGVTRNKYEAMLYPLVESSLSSSILELWQRAKNAAGASSKKTLDDLMTFLKNEVSNISRMEIARSTLEDSSTNTGKVIEPLATASSLVNQGQQKASFHKPATVTCLFCDRSHSSSECVTAQRMSLEERKAIIKKKEACSVCLKSHKGKCYAVVRCIFCGTKHYPILCPQVKAVDTQHPSKDHKTKAPPSHTAANMTFGDVFLQILRVEVSGLRQARNVRTGIDSFSQLSYISEECAKHLGLRRVGTVDISHQLFGGQISPASHAVYVVNVRNLNTDFSCQLQVLSQPRICNDVAPVTDPRVLKELQDKGIVLTDVGPPGPIDLLIGADAEGLLRTGRQHKLLHGPVAIETKLGWTVAGKLSSSTQHKPIINMANHGLPALWELERLGIQDPIETKNKRALDDETYTHFYQTIKRNGQRYQVAMPWLADHAQLQPNFHMAFQRLKAVTAKLRQSGNFEAYDTVLKEWEANGIIERVHDYHKDVAYLLPHHPVIRPDAEKTKIRPVFDATAKAINGSSLNECLSAGPNLIELIPTILTQFRNGPIGVTADIRKAFLQLELAEDDRRYLGFLWWDSDGKFAYYRHCRVVFGVTCSPFLLNATVQYHLNDMQFVPENLHETAKELQKSFYIDDCLNSLRDYASLQRFITEATDVMALGSFDLTQWKFTGMENPPEATKVLGLTWKIQRDELQCVIPDIKDEVLNQQVTKRDLLSLANSFYDPLGFLAPATLLLKLGLQQAWIQKCAWDDICPGDIPQDVAKWAQHIGHLATLSVPRSLDPFPASSRQLHVFCDASARAYAAVVYMRSTNGHDVSVRLLQAKARLAPILKPHAATPTETPRQNIPRLELMAACIGVRLVTSIRACFNEDLKIYFWSDSMIVLHWIKNESKWSTFVDNRKKEILKYTAKNEWRHVPGKLNPADLPSRGCDGQQLHNSNWLQGPEFLLREKEHWPPDHLQCSAEEIALEQRPQIFGLVNVNTEVDYTRWLEQSSSYNTTLAAIARTKKAIRQWRLPKEKRTKIGPTIFKEIKAVENEIISWAQAQSINERSLTFPHEYQNGVLCVQTKLTDAAVANNPILLPKRHLLTEKIIEEQHRKLGHAGTATTLHALRKRFWIIQGRRTVRKVVLSCTGCKRFHAKPVQTPPTTLPEDRTKLSAPFSVTGVNFAGPLNLKGQPGAPLQKAYICLFTCAVYRAVHLELVSSLSTNCFLQTFRRFIKRRGRPKTVYSDNGTNFVGAVNQLRNLDIPTHQIEWKFIPPSAPWWGGFWERMVRTTKDLLKRNIGNALLTFEETTTVLCSVEDTINSRPLTYLPTDPTEFQALTPNDFLRPLQGSDTDDLDAIDAAQLRSRVRYMQDITHNLNMRFQTEYLANLVHRGKANIRFTQLKVGDIVLVSDGTNKRLRWPLARVIAVFPGRDHIVRQVKLRLQQGEIVRPVQKVYPLELSVTDGQALKSDNSQLLAKSTDGALSNSGKTGKVILSHGKVPKKQLLVPKQTQSLNKPVPIQSPRLTRVGRAIRLPSKLNL